MRSMREIKFRGKRVDNCEWVYGNYVWFTGNGFKEHHKVIPESVGQYTGLVDKNGVGIYEGDIVRQTHFGNEIEFVLFEDGCFVVKSDYTLTSIISDFKKEKIEVIGNIHDNPELLKTK